MFLLSAKDSHLHDSLVYSAGEVIDFTGSLVVNNSNLPQPAQIVLKCFVKQTGGYGVNHTFTKDYVLYETVIPENQTVVLMNHKDFHQVRVPAIPPSYSGEFMEQDGTSRGKACVRWAYTLEIRLVEWGTGFYSRTPILVSAAPPYSNQLHDLRHTSADPEFVDQWSIFRHAVFGPRNNDMAPDLGRHNDKGRLSLVDGGEPIWLGQPADYTKWMKEAKNRQRYRKWAESGADDPTLGELFYRPVVNTYAGPSFNRRASETGSLPSVA